MLRFGPATGPVVVVALPLFEEANRTRAFAVTILRALAKRGIVGLLPDLPGQGESLIPTHETDLDMLRTAFAAAVPGGDYPVFTFAIRSGALLDTEAPIDAHYHLSPVTGTDLRRELIRTRQASAREAGEPFDPAGIDTATEPVELAGNLIAPRFLAQLTAATPSETIVRTVRLETEARPADAKLPGSPLWRRAEPDNDLAFAQAVGDDIARWVELCAG
ncbi:hypothetical protein [Sphingomonas koreensis]